LTLPGRTSLLRTGRHRCRAASLCRLHGRRVILPNLKPSLKTISLRLPELMLAELKLLANKRDVPYQSLIKMFLADRLEEELEHQDS
jgi:hypothetical protein